MRVIYKGHAITTFGKDRVSITDREGREIYNGQREFTSEEDARQFLKEFLKGGKENGRISQ